jgi:hypothetical protein
VVSGRWVDYFVVFGVGVWFLGCLVEDLEVFVYLLEGVNEYCCVMGC